MMKRGQCNASRHKLSPCATRFDLGKLRLWGNRIFGIDFFDNFTGRRRGGELQERIFQNLFLQFTHTGFAERVADLKILRIKRTRRTHLFGNFGADRDEYRRQAELFDFTLYRDDRPVADVWSASG